MTDWITRWQIGRIGWHREVDHSKLIEFIDYLKLHLGDTVFVPLCGKSNDMNYFLERGFRVIGVELSELAIVHFFDEHNLKYSIQETGKFNVYQSDYITLYCGDYL